MKQVICLRLLNMQIYAKDYMLNTIYYEYVIDNDVRTTEVSVYHCVCKMIVVTSKLMLRYDLNGLTNA